MHAPKIIKRRSIHSGRLERWLGKEKVEKLAHDMRNGGGPGVRWYYEPINLRDVPGSVWVTADGDFVGDFERGGFASAIDHFSDHIRALWKAAGRPIYEREPVFGAGFASISDALAKASTGYSQPLNGAGIVKTGASGTINLAMTLWNVGAVPPAGAVGGAAPGGTVHTKSDTGAMIYNNPATGTLHLTGADFAASVINNSVLLYDRLFSVAKTMNSTATEAVTGVPTRYTSTTATNPDYIGGNFLFVECTTALPATAHNWTVCTYTDQANAASTLPSVTGTASLGISGLDIGSGRWFCPLETGDVGIKALTQMQCSALVASGAVSFVIGHAIGVMAFPLLQTSMPFDWLTNRNQAPRIFDNACLAMLEMPKPTVTATTYMGQLYALNAP